MQSKKYTVAVFIFLLFGLIYFAPYAKAECGFNSIGDYTCDKASGSTSGGTGGEMPSSTNIFLNSVLPSVLNQSSCSGLSYITNLLQSFDSNMQDALAVKLISLLGASSSNCDDLNKLLAQIAALQSLLGSVAGDPCSASTGGGEGSSGDAFKALLFNKLSVSLTISGGSVPTSLSGLTGSVCSEVESSGGPTSSGPEADPVGKWCPDAKAAAYATDSTLPGTYKLNSTSPGDKIAESAKLSIGATTGDDPAVTSKKSGRKGGLGCALAVSRILYCAGFKEAFSKGTTDLWAQLEKSGCYQKVDTGSLSAGQLQPGDVLITRTSGTPGGNGHTGVYVGNGDIVSNSSSGYAGSGGEKVGGVKQNYTVDTWNSKVITRAPNPADSGVFRRTC